MNNSLITTSAIAMVRGPAKESLFLARLRSLKNEPIDSTTTILTSRIFSYDCFFEKAPSLKKHALMFLMDAIKDYMRSDYFDPSYNGIFKSEIYSLSTSPCLDECDKDILQSIFVLSLSDIPTRQTQQPREIMYAEEMVAYLKNPCVTESDVAKFIGRVMEKISSNPAEGESRGSTVQLKYIFDLLNTFSSEIEHSAGMSAIKIMAYNDVIVSLIENEEDLVEHLDSWLISANGQSLEPATPSSNSSVLSAANEMADALSKVPIHLKELDLVYSVIMGFIDGVRIEQGNFALTLIELAKRLASKEEEINELLSESGNLPDVVATNEKSNSDKLEFAVVTIGAFIREHFHVYSRNDDLMFDVVKSAISDNYLCNCSMSYLSIISSVFDSGIVGANVITRCLSAGILSPYFNRVFSDRHLVLNCTEEDLYATLKALLSLDDDENPKKKGLAISIINRLMTQFYYPALLNGDPINIEHLSVTTGAAVEYKSLGVDDLAIISKAGLANIINGIGDGFYELLKMQSSDFIEATSSLLLSERTSELTAPPVIKRNSFII